MVHYTVPRRTQRDLKLRPHSHHGFGQQSAIAAHAQNVRTVAAHQLWDGEQVVDIARAGWLWEVVISARGDTIACTKGRQ